MESYRKTLGLTDKELGDRLLPGADPGYVRRVALGLVWPAPEVIGAIVTASEGQITVEAMHRRVLDVREGRLAPRRTGERAANAA